jgi:hypothetical protein
MALLKSVLRLCVFVSLGQKRHRFKKFLVSMPRSSIRKIRRIKNGFFFK